MDWQSLQVVTPPAAEPLTTAQAKLHLRVDHVEEDDYIGALIVAARVHVEEVTGLALLTQTRDAKLDGWPDCRHLQLPRPPLQSVTSITYQLEDGSTSTLSSSSYLVDTASKPGRVFLQDSADWPSEALAPGASVTVRYVAGYGAAGSAVPAPLVHAIRLLVGHWFTHREAVIDLGRRELVPVPMAVNYLLSPFRIYKF